jgi:NitT/TauT family transport system substrate-binding protein
MAEHVADFRSGGGEMRSWLRFGCLAAAVSLFLPGASQAEPLRIAYVIWVGYGPLFVAQEKGFFAGEGIEVHMINTEGGHWEAVLDGQVDALGTSINSMPMHYVPDKEPVCVLAMSESSGGDGILATTDIHSIADLKGRTVAFQELTVQQFYLNALLKESGLSEADIEPVHLDGQDAGEAFMLQEVDAAVTYEPWLTQGKATEHGHVIADSSQQPGLIIDCLATPAAVFKDRNAEFRALARAWAGAVDFVREHPDEANEIMARNVGGWLEDPAVFAETLKGIRFYDEQRNREYFGTPERPGQIYDTAQKIIDVWTSLGVLKARVTPADFIAHGIWEE